MAVARAQRVREAEQRLRRAWATTASDASRPDWVGTPAAALAERRLLGEVPPSAACQRAAALLANARAAVQRAARSADATVVSPRVLSARAVRRSGAGSQPAALPAPAAAPGSLVPRSPAAQPTPSAPEATALVPTPQPAEPLRADTASGELVGVHLFAGSGGLAHAARCVCPEAALYCEIDSQSQQLLRLAMAAGHIPEAPVWGDIRTLLASPSARLLGGRQLWTVSYPCQGNSACGLHQGLEHEETALLHVLLDAITACKPHFALLENVPGAIGNGQLELVELRLSRWYDISFGTFSAPPLGGLVVRNRMFILLSRKGHTLPALPSGCLNALLCSMGPEPARCVNPALGAVRAGQRIAGDCVHLGTVLQALMVLSDQTYDPPPPPKTVRLVMDPRACDGLRKKRGRRSRATMKMVTAPVVCYHWPAPRARGGWGVYSGGFTSRGLRDLATAVRYEVGTPNEQRLWHVNPAWVAWLLCYPPAYSELFSRV